MINAVFDASIVACPTLDISKSEFETYINEILFLNSIHKENKTKLFKTSKTEEILFSTGKYPYKEELSKLLIALGLTDMIQASDLYTLLNIVLEKTLTLESILDIEEILEDSIVIEPAMFNNNLDQKFIEESKRVIILISFYEHIKEIHPDSHVYFTRTITPTNLHITCRGELVDCQFVVNNNAYTFPLSLENELPISSVNNNFVLVVNIVKLWKKIQSNQDISTLFGIHLLSENKKRMKNMDMLDLGKWTLNNKFYETVSRLNFIMDETKTVSLLNAMTDVLLKDNLSQIHALRENSGGGSAQVTRNKDKAMRKDIDHEFHLHYWETENGPEFASVNVHRDMGIPK